VGIVLVILSLHLFLIHLSLLPVLSYLHAVVFVDVDDILSVCYCGFVIAVVVEVVVINYCFRYLLA
jgi:hypothetical protein